MNNKLNFKKAMIQTRHPSKHHHEWIHRRLLMYLSTAFSAPSHTLNFWFWKCMMSVWWFSNSSNSSDWSYVSNTSCVHFQTHIHSHMSILYGMSHVNFSSTLKILSLLWSLTQFLPVYKYLILLHLLISITFKYSLILICIEHFLKVTSFSIHFSFDELSLSNFYLITKTIEIILNN